MKRREFIIAGGLAASSVALGASNLGKTAPPSDSIKLGVIGTGSRGTGIIKILKDIPAMEVAACCDVLPFRLEEALKHAADGAKGYSDYRKLLENKDLDAIIIATPYALHYEMAMDAVDADFHVYCEKTLVHDIKPAKKLVEKVKSQGKIFQVGHQYHNSRLYVAMAGIIQSGQVGEIVGIDCQWNRNGDWRRSVPDPKWERAINWRMYKEFSGGLVAELCSHQLDFINWITGTHPVKVAGFGGIDYWKDGRETFDNIRLFYEYPDGMKASFTCLTTNSYGDYLIKVMGKKFTVEIDYRKATMYSEDSDIQALGEVDGVSGATLKAWEKGEGVTLNIEHEEPTRQALLDFGGSILTGKEPISNVETGALASICVRMGLTAMEKEKVIHWKPSYDIG